MRVDIFFSFRYSIFCNKQQEITHFMAHFYNYYYVGDLNLTEDELHRSPPLLLTFSKVQNGPKGEVPPHMHAHLEIFYFESGTGFFDLNGQTHSIKAMRPAPAPGG